MVKTLPFANIAAFIITVVINYLSNTGIFNGNTMSTVSAQYQNNFTPAGYAFSIWGLIYLALLGFVVYQFRSNSNHLNSDKLVSRIGWWFVVSCAANSLWVIAWLYDYTGMSVLLMVILLFSLLKIVVRTGMELHEVPFKTLALIWWPFCLYSGWITVALIANIAAYLTKLGWDGSGISEVGWTIIMISVAGAINLFMTWKRNMREFALVGIWGLIAVAMANWDEQKEVANAALLVSAIIFISTMLHAYKNRKSLADLFKSQLPAR